MKARLAAVSAVFGLVLMAPWSSASGSSAVAVMRVTPYQGHSGDLVDLSGSGFLPRVQMYVMMACPNAADPFMYAHRNFVGPLLGPITDANGEFAGFLFRAPKLAGIPNAGCTVYEVDPQHNQPFGAPGAIPGVYTIVRPGVKLARCQRTLCVTKVVAAPRRIRAGLKEHIMVKGWPGARVDTVFTYPSKQPEHHVAHLDWTGTYSLTETVPSALPNQMSVRVTVHASLGKMTDTRQGSFIVTR